MSCCQDGDKASVTTQLPRHSPVNVCGIIGTHPTGQGMDLLREFEEISGHDGMDGVV